jgi:PPOX class probable F420-dependent enzyme
MATIPERYQDLLARDKKAFAFLAVVLKDGSPHVTPVWFDWDGTHIIINTARGRVKERALKREARVSLAIADPADPYRYMQIRGRVDSETEEGGYDMICKLYRKYLGDSDFPKRPGEVRVTYTILPERVVASYNKPQPRPPEPE